MNKGYFSLSVFFIAKPIDYFLEFDDKKLCGFFVKHLVARVIALALVVFAVFDAAFHLLMIMLEVLRGRIREITTRVFLSAQFLFIAIVSPLEIIQPDSLTQPLLDQICTAHSHLANDVSGLNPTKLMKIYSPKTEEELQNIIKDAQKNKSKICIGGQKHSQGGHQFCENGIYIDMRKFNRILNLDSHKKTITVQSGITWEKVQDYIHAKGFAIKVMQASNIFTVGGSLSVNGHGWDHRFGPLIETIKQIRLLMPDGTIQIASRTKNSELFQLAIGGYGLFGIILDAEIELTDNDNYEKSAKVFPTKEYRDYFLQNVLNHPEIGLHYARLSLNPRENMSKLIAVDYKKTSSPVDFSDLSKEKNINRNRFLFHLYRRSSLVKQIRGPLEISRERRTNVITRNHAMRPEVHFLDYHCSRDTDILQEYFVPVEHFETFIHRLHQIVQQENINLLNVTVRFVKKNNSTFLSYAKKDSFAFVLYLNQKTSSAELEKAKIWTQKITQEALDLGGSYYLPYHQWHTKEQFVEAYPRFEEFIKKKKKYDSQNLFHSTFYETCLERWNATQADLQENPWICA